MERKSIQMVEIINQVQYNIFYKTKGDTVWKTQDC